VNMRVGPRLLSAEKLLSTLASLARVPLAPGLAGGLAHGKEVERLRITFPNRVGFGPLYLAADKGILADRGLELVLAPKEPQALRRAHLRTGALDAQAGPIDLLVSDRAVSVPVVAVAELDMSFGASAVVAAKDVRSVTELAGKNVALAHDEVGETFLAYLLLNAGLSIDQAHVVPMVPKAACHALMNGEVDAAVTWEPWVTKARTRPGAHVLASTRDEPGVIADLLSVTEQALRERPQAIEALVSGWYEAVDYYQAHPVEASQIIAPRFVLTPEQYRRDTRGLHWPTCEEALEHFGTREHPGRLHEVLDTIVRIKREHGRILSKPCAAHSLSPDILLAVADSGPTRRRAGSPRG